MMTENQANPSQPKTWRTNNLPVVRGAVIAAVLALLAGFADWVSDAWVMEYGLDAVGMMLMSGGFAAIAGCSHYLRSSAEVELGETTLRLRSGWNLVNGRWSVVRWDRIHSATVTAPRSMRFLSRAQPMITLFYRSPEKKMMAVPLLLPIGNLDRVVELLREIESRTDLVWKLHEGGIDSGKRVELDDLVKALPPGQSPLSD